MKEILESHREAVTEAAREVIQIGSSFLEGRMDDVFSQATAARQKYKEWERIDVAIAGVKRVIEDRKSATQVGEILIGILGDVVREAVLRVEKGK